jgi:ribose/xylose/arabinose/galactoside ABC-type transport system permease subunit
VVPALLLLGVLFGLMLGIVLGLGAARARRVRLVATIAALTLATAWGVGVAVNAEDTDWPASLFGGTLVALASEAVGLLVGATVGAAIGRLRRPTPR